MYRSICLFPQFNNIKLINAIRKKYDSLYKIVPPHITLIFPFRSEISTSELKAHMENVLLEENTFNITLKGITGSEGGYLFLGVKEGNDSIIRLHDKLYGGMLAQFYNRKISYLPHMTVGRVHNEHEFEGAIEVTEAYNENFCSKINNVYLESIHDDGKSEIEHIHRLS
ncbi:2'-5' RNA ligase family protein [Falsibacillus albus]|uniref:2'-5' RNA ligase family protein n=1 Tax=Falsibacillus albus TaxID=2478915 RepID=A0A3L7JVM6_9BACI|nr:2'-5' RNA ligase family protein [Falsibacillus albus]